VSDPAPARGPGRPPRLSRDGLLDAAEALVEREGIEALTMRRLAEELRSSPMALYRHVRDKDELLVLLLDRRAAELPHPPLPDDPRARLLVLFGLLHDGLAESPWIVEVLVKGDLVAPSVLWVVDEILAAFVAAGLPPERAAAAYHVAWRYTVGELTVRYASARHLARLEREPMLPGIIAEAEPDELPTLAALAPQLATARKRLSFEEGLAAVIDGLLSDNFAY
jgi:AcrR family transcriptional regulator